MLELSNDDAQEDDAPFQHITLEQRPNFANTSASSSRQCSDDASIAQSSSSSSSTIQRAPSGEGMASTQVYASSDKLLLEELLMYASVQAPLAHTPTQGLLAYTPTQDLLAHIVAIQDPTMESRYTKGYKERVANILGNNNVTAQDMYGRMEKLDQKEGITWKDAYPLVYKALVALRANEKAAKTGVSIAAPSVASAQRSYRKTLPRETLFTWLSAQNLPMTNAQECQAAVERAAQEHELTYSTIFGRLARYKQKHQSDSSIWTPELEGLRKIASHLRMKVYTKRINATPKMAQEKIEHAPITILPKID